MTSFEKSNLKFLKDLSANNNRDWFQDNKDRYEALKENSKAFLSDLEKEMNKHDVIEKTKLFRIYRDVRFSKDKTPYNTHVSMSMSREGALRRGGYYLRLQPGNSFLAAGFWGPEKDDLKLIRDHLNSDATRLRKVLNAKKFKDTFGDLEGEQLKSAPRGYDKEHPDVDLLKFKQFIVTRQYSEKEITDPGFIKELVKSYKAVLPFFDYMSEILTHDLNGVPLYKA